MRRILGLGLHHGGSKLGFHHGLRHQASSSYLPSGEAPRSSFTGMSVAPSPHLGGTSASPQDQASPGNRVLFHNKSSRKRSLMANSDLTLDSARIFQQHLLHTSPTEGEDADLRWRSPWQMRIEDINEVGGTGTELYFKLVRTLGLCFAAMTGVTLPIVAFSWVGDFSPARGGVPHLLSRLTIGNLGNLALGGLHQDGRYVLLGCQGRPLSELTVAFSWLDAAATLIFLLCVARFYYIEVPAVAAFVLPAIAMVLPL